MRRYKNRGTYTRDYTPTSPALALTRGGSGGRGTDYSYGVGRNNIHTLSDLQGSSAGSGSSSSSSFAHAFAAQHSTHSLYDTDDEGGSKEDSSYYSVDSDDEGLYGSGGVADRPFSTRTSTRGLAARVAGGTAGATRAFRGANTYGVGVGLLSERNRRLGGLGMIPLLAQY